VRQNKCLPTYHTNQLPFLYLTISILAKIPFTRYLRSLIYYKNHNDAMYVRKVVEAPSCSKISLNSYQESCRVPKRMQIP
jgi:hypothetical protein